MLYAFWQLKTLILKSNFAGEKCKFHMQISQVHSANFACEIRSYFSGEKSLYWKQASITCSTIIACCPNVRRKGSRHAINTRWNCWCTAGWWPSSFIAANARVCSRGANQTWPRSTIAIHTAKRRDHSQGSGVCSSIAGFAYYSVSVESRLAGTFPRLLTQGVPITIGVTRTGP